MGKKVLLFTALALLIYFVLSKLNAIDPSGYSYSFPEPEIIQSEETTRKYDDKTVLKLIRKFHLKSVVLCLKVDNLYSYSPMVMMLGWGKMSVGRNILGLPISYNRLGNGRMSSIKNNRTHDITPEEFNRSICNAYVIPGDDFIKKKLLRLNQFDVVEITGHLAHLITPGGTLTLSTDFAEYKCKFMVVDDLRVLSEK